MKSYTTKKGTELPIMDIKGKPYLQVAYRIVWYREDNPGGRIVTEAVNITENSALFRATVYSKEGTVLSTAHKFEDRKGFPDFIEKAETGSIGRALALCGYGTQFCADELDEGERLADSPLTSTQHSISNVTNVGQTKQPLAAVKPGEFPNCCGQPMRVSQYNQNQLYCIKCKAKQNIAA